MDQALLTRAPLEKEEKKKISLTLGLKQSAAASNIKRNE